FAPQEAAAASQLDTKVAQATGSDAAAEALYKSSVVNAAAQFYQDKAVASRKYDYATAAAGVAEVGTLAPDYAAYFIQVNSGGQVTENVGADNLAANAAYVSAVQSARQGEISSYGDAEVSDAQTSGQAEITLANSEGFDETNLANQQAAIASTLAAQGGQADEILVGTVSQANAEQAGGIAAAVADWTAKAANAEKDSVHDLGLDEVDLAAKLAGAEADYAIAQAEEQATLAASFAQGTTSAEAAFQALYAEGYVQWLTDLKPAFVANSTAMAQDDAQQRQNLETALDNLANQRATAETSLMTDSGSSATDLANAKAGAEDGYQAESVTVTTQYASDLAAADAKQSGNLAKAAAAYMLASAQADKDNADNAANGVANHDDLYKKALADAKLTLVDAQADADLGWVQDAAQADFKYRTDDAANWQTMINTEAEKADQFAHETNAENETEANAIAQAAAGTMVPKAQAQQTQANGDAAAAADFRIAQANETATVWNWLANQIGTPWAQSQAGLAGAEATWSVTAAANYQQYVAALGTHLVQYATTDACQFLSEMTTINSTDHLDSDKLADAQKTLTETVTADEVTFEGKAALANKTYQNGLGQADHDYRYRAAQADHDLTISGNQAAYAAAMAIATSDRASDKSQAVSDFEASVGPAVVKQASDDADATLAEATSEADLTLDDALTGNQAAHDYQYAEAAASNGKQRDDAQSLRDYLVTDANGHAATIAAFALANPSPWADLAAQRAAADAQQQINDADAQLAQSNADADAQQTQTKAEADAEKTADDANAQARHDQAVSQAQAAHDVTIWQSDVTDAVFALLPDPLLPPADGSAPTLTADFTWGYEANDFYLYPTFSPFGEAGSMFGPEWQPWMGVPNFMPDFGTPFYAYDWTGYGHSMPWGLLGLGGSFDPNSVPPPDNADEVIGGGGVGSYGNPIPFGQPILARGNLPLPSVYRTAMHFAGNVAALLLVAAEASDGQSWTDWFKGLFYKPPKRDPNGPPSWSGGAQGPPSQQDIDPANHFANDVENRGRARTESSLVNGHADVKNSINYGNYQTAIYEGIADALE
ncbi:MAG TPA: hypothetical protein VGX76_25100, partial [Pirellulales bacterium]|nr:hypothetical protein [Pirellulales bacterium]